MCAPVDGGAGRTAGFVVVRKHLGGERLNARPAPPGIARQAGFAAARRHLAVQFHSRATCGSNKPRRGPNEINSPSQPTSISAGAISKSGESTLISISSSGTSSGESWREAGIVERGRGGALAHGLRQQVEDSTTRPIHPRISPTVQGYECAEFRPQRAWKRIRIESASADHGALNRASRERQQGVLLVPSELQHRILWRTSPTRRVRSSRAPPWEVLRRGCEGWRRSVARTARNSALPRSGRK